MEVLEGTERSVLNKGLKLEKNIAYPPPPPQKNDRKNPPVDVH